ncbi:hypothetical protein VP01_2409g1 [Puccinia sorghi]|uniref:Uncharacterized protein n=1 Tax=Puccinia sorghi TaxID=27349 RepID=A0A0L6V7C4_9BASI|nr:hypothetical protein VP01_2409g1 [Puccinia sorghi]
MKSFLNPPVHLDGQCSWTFPILKFEHQNRLFSGAGFATPINWICNPHKFRQNFRCCRNPSSLSGACCNPQKLVCQFLGGCRTNSAFWSGCTSIIKNRGNPTTPSSHHNLGVSKKRKDRKMGVCKIVLFKNYIIKLYPGMTNKHQKKKKEKNEKWTVKLVILFFIFLHFVSCNFMCIIVLLCYLFVLRLLATFGQIQFTGVANSPLFSILISGEGQSVVQASSSVALNGLFYPSFRIPKPGAMMTHSYKEAPTPNPTGTGPGLKCLNTTGTLECELFSYYGFNQSGHWKSLSRCYWDTHQCLRSSGREVRTYVFFRQLNGKSSPVWPCRHKSSFPQILFLRTAKFWLSLNFLALSHYAFTPFFHDSLCKSACHSSLPCGLTNSNLNNSGAGTNYTVFTWNPQAKLE